MRALVVAIALLAFAAPEDDEPLARARRLYHLRDHDAAEQALLILLEKDREEVEAFKLLAEVYLRSERPGEAARAVEKGLAVAPEDPYLHATRWEVGLARAGWTKEARQSLRKEVDAFLAAATEPWQLTAAHLGFSLLTAKAAKAKLRERILREVPGDPPEELEGDILEAVITDRTVEGRVTLVHQFEKLFPESKQKNHLREIMLYMVRDDRDRLLAEAERILDSEPENRRVSAALARWLLEIEPADADRALVEIAKALTLLDAPREIDRPELASDTDWERMLRETRGRYLSYRGRALALGGDPQRACEAFAEASGILSHDVNLYLWKGQALEALGRTDEAVDAYARSVASGASPVAVARLFSLLPRSETLRDALAPRLGPSPRFVDATGAVSLAGARGRRVSVADVDGDGWPDLLLGGRRLYLNREGTFEPAPLPDLPGARGGILADLDNDGDVDLLSFRTEHPMVLANDGTGRFSDRTPEAMAAVGICRTEAAAVFDADGDGLLDLYLANYERPPTPPLARGTRDMLWRNLGDFAFEPLPIKGLSAEPMCGRGAAAADFDNDGDTDLYVANYRLDPDYLLVNDGKGLVNEARARGVEGECDEGYFGHGIGCAWGDLDGDGHLDVVVGNLAHPRYIGFSDATRIFISSGPPDYRFRDVFRESGVRYEETHSNPSLADVDLDGDLDLYLTSVYVGRKSFLYLNDGKAKFRDATWIAGVREDNGWGSAFSDIDLDGDPDLLVCGRNGLRLYRNLGPSGDFLGLTLAGGDCCNGTGVGARVTLTGAGRSEDVRSDLGRPLVREVRAGTGTGCQDDPSLRFGVGERKGPFGLTVRWPCGRLQSILGVAPGHVYRLVEGGNLEAVK